MKAIALTYHDVTDGLQAGHKALYKIDHRDFHDHILSIRGRLDGTDVSRIDAFRCWKKTEVPVFLTFDDGELGAFNYVADELEQYGWRGHFFITTDWIGRPGFMNRRQIRELRDRGHVIGSHSCSHPSRMSRLSTDELRREWSESCAILADILGEKISVASVPDGYYSWNVGWSASAAGLGVLFTSEATAAVSVLSNCLILGRYSIQIHTPPEVSGAIASSEIWPRWRQTFLWESKKCVKAVTGESYLTVRRYLLSRLLPKAATPVCETESSGSTGIGKKNGF
jgi:peptidoglycan/xylan/chitin deacetylase (PgdA/CDA1 family)